MSINVTVSGNPISIRRGKMILSDHENIRKFEKEHRKRLRLEQVHEQSRALSKSLLERARKIEKEQLSRLEKDPNTEMRRAHERRLMEVHRRYQETENIGYAHENASKQPDIEYIRRTEEQKNKAAAKERGMDAIQKLQESSKVVSPRVRKQERLQRVRNLENERSRMVAQLPKKSSAPSQNCKKTSPQINISINNEETIKIPTTSTFGMNKTQENNYNKVNNIPIDTTQDSNHVCESDDNEPRQNVPVTSTISSKLEQTESRYSSTDSSTTSSSSISDDSSYFSDNASKTVIKKNSTPSKVNLYDHCTRQRSGYNLPSGFVERTNIKNKPSAVDLAEEIKKLESENAAARASQKENSKLRSKDAVLREKIRRDYQALCKKIDELSREERRAKAHNLNEQVLPPSKRAENTEKRQKKMDRAFQTILRSSREAAPTTYQVERPITITPRDYIHSNTGWQEPPDDDQQETEESYSEEDSEYTRKRKISELLIKIEKLKRKLLQEYGADLPDDVFNASVKSLFNQTSSSTMNATRTNKTNKKEEDNKSKPAKEIQVINMSGCEENPKKHVPKVANKSKKINRCQTPRKCLQKSAVETTVSTRDQEIQVQLKSDKTTKNEVHHPIEPIVKIVTPENANNNNSSSCDNSSTSTDLVVDVSKTEITVIPKEKESLKISKGCSSTNSLHSCSNTQPVKISFDRHTVRGESFEVVIDAVNKEIIFSTKEKQNLKTISRKLSPVASEKCHSLPGSRTNSPVKKTSRSAPSSRYSSPKKLHSHLYETQEQISFKEQKYRTQSTQMSIDSSTESSQMNSTSENGKFYSRFQTLATRRIISKLQDTSDTSTTYASPPAVAPGALLSAMNSSTPILELLDSSANESIKCKRTQVSPVSSPETPSPRTMKLPSNIPKAGRVNKSLKFTSLVNTQTKPDSSVISKNIQTTYSMSKNKPAAVRSASHSQTCNCRNPACKLLHIKVEDKQNYTLKHCPEILKKYEDLQNVCTERIASLTDLIQKVRNEQKGLELSVVSNEDSNSGTQNIPNSQYPARGDMSNVVKNVEVIYSELKKTLLESRKIISGEAVELPKSTVPLNKFEKSPSLSFDLSKELTTSESTEEDVEKLAGIAIVRTPVAAPKPKILSDEQVQINLDRFRASQSLKGAYKSAETCKSPLARPAMVAETSTRSQDKSDDMVEKLSKEILEQSKSINKSVPDSLKDDVKDDLKDDDSLLKSSQAHVKDVEDSNKLAVSHENSQENKSENLEMSDSDFIPLLAGIPKIMRTKGSANGRGRPPVTLISGPYRQEIDSPAHELSTIVEFDTPDTVNKSQASHRSPSNKARRKLPTDDPSQFTISPQSRKSTDSKLAKSKPSVRVCPLPSHQSPKKSLNLSNKSAKSIERSPRKSIEKSLESLEKKKLEKNESKKDESSDSMYTLSDVHIEQLQYSQNNTEGNYECRISEISELHSLPDETIEQMLISEICEESKSKSTTPVQKPVDEKQEKQEQEKAPLTSTSSTSISGLSGVSEITSSPSSDKNLFKCPSSPEEMELALKKWGLGWAIPTLKKTREASALGSSSSSDVTPVNTATRLVSPVKKHQEGTPHEFPEISDVSSISIKHANKSTERSVLVKGRTSTPNRLSCTNSDGTVSTLGSFSSDLNIVVQNQSADITIPNISFSNNNLA